MAEDLSGSSDGRFRLTHFAPAPNEEGIGKGYGKNFLWSLFGRNDNQPSRSSSDEGITSDPTQPLARPADNTRPLQIPAHDRPHSNVISNCNKTDSLPKTRDNNKVMNRRPSDSTAGQRRGSTGSQRHNSAKAIIPGIHSNTSTHVPTRTLQTVLRRIGSLHDKASSSAAPTYQDSEFKQYWMPDSNSKECYDCGLGFSMFRRRHHCRVCGQIFCYVCCNLIVTGKLIGIPGNLRVCTYCYKVMHSYVNSVNPDSTTSHDSEDTLNLSENSAESSEYLDVGHFDSKNKPTSPVFDEDPLLKRMSATLETNSAEKPVSQLSPVIPNYEPLSVTGIERRILEDSTQLRDLWLEILNSNKGISLSSHRYRLRNYANCLVGREIVDWLLNDDKASSRMQAMAIGQALLDGKWLVSTTGIDNIFRDQYILYSPGPSTSSRSLTNIQSPDNVSLIDEDDPCWVREITPNDEDTIDQTTDTTQTGGEFIDSDAHSTFYMDMKDENFRRVSRSDPRQISMSDNVMPYRQHTPCYHGNDRCNIGYHSTVDTSTTTLTTDTGSRVAHTFSWTRWTPDSDFLNKTQSVRAIDWNYCNEISSGILEEESLLDGVDDVFTPHDMISTATADRGEKTAIERISSSQYAMNMRILDQLLEDENLPRAKWADCVYSLVNRIAGTVRCDVRYDSDDMDIRQYVHIKKLPGAIIEDCCIVNGVVSSNKIAHKKMSSHLQNPHILVMECAIEYQRIEGKLSSLEPIMMQEKEYIKNCVAKIVALQPDLLIVEKTVSRLAQEKLLEAGVTLVLNCKPQVIDRIVRCSQSTLMRTIDQVTTTTRSLMGMCRVFRLSQYKLDDGSQKALMFIEGCPTHLGCTVILRGGDSKELSKVKKVLKFMLYVAYNSHLETCYLIDSCSLPPSLGLDLNQRGRKRTPSGAETLSGRGAGPPGPAVSDPPVEVFSTSIFEGITAGQNAPLDLTAIGIPVRDRSSAVNSQTEKTDHAFLGAIKECPHQIPSEQIIDFSNLLQRDSEKFADTCLELGTEPDENAATSSPSSAVDGNCESQQHPQEESEESIAVARFLDALDSTVLTCSPHLDVKIPFLLSPAGLRSPMQRYFSPAEYWSRKSKPPDIRHANAPGVDGCGQGAPDKSALTEEMLYKFSSDFVTSRPPHRFTSKMVTTPSCDTEFRTELAEFRAMGGSYNVMPLAAREAKVLETLSAEWKQKEMAESESGADHVDCLMLHTHNRLIVLFSSFSTMSDNYPDHCVHPWIVKMGYYETNDITLGEFLQRYCFRENYICSSPTCGTGMSNHVRRFVHESGTVQVSVRELSSPMPDFNEHVLMWKMCKKCRQLTPVMPMSWETWSFSLAKFLEICFHGHKYGRRASSKPCPHSLHRDHYHYFGYKNVVAIFVYIPVQVYELSLPPPKIVTKKPTFQAMKSGFIDEIKMLSVTGYSIYSSIHDRLMSLRHEQAGWMEKIASLIAREEEERSGFRVTTEKIQILVTMPKVMSPCDSSWQDSLEETAPPRPVMVPEDELYIISEIEDLMVLSKRKIAETVQAWNKIFLDLHENVKRKSPEPSFNSNAPSLPRSHDAAAPVPAVKENISTKQCPTTMAEIKNSVTRSGLKSYDDDEDDDDEYNELILSELITARGDPESYRYHDDLSPVYLDVGPGIETEAYSSSESFYACGESDENRHHDGRLRSTSDEEQDRSDHLLEQPVCEQPESDHLSEQQGSESLAEQQGCDHVSEQPVIMYGNGVMEDKPAEIEAAEPESGLGKNSDKRTMRNFIAHLLPSIAYTPLTSSFPANENYLLAAGRVPLVVYDDELSSIIAYTLASSEYIHWTQHGDVITTTDPDGDTGFDKKSVLSKVSDEGRIQIQSPRDDVGETPGNSKGVKNFFRRNMSRDRSPAPTSSRATSTSIKGDEPVFYTARKDPSEASNVDVDVEGTDQHQISNQHFESEFSNSTSKFYCKVFFASEFEDLRKKVIGGDCEEDYIRSMSRCVSWVTGAGKSGSHFSKSKDDRYVMKQMSRQEIANFMEFAPHYFDYMCQTLARGEATVMSKIVGVYRVSYRNSQTNVALKQDLLVMENLFYGHKISKVFDLKGSLRNRDASTSRNKDGNVVWLDINFQRIMCRSPIYVRPFSKKILLKALNNDTKFLSTNMVMDYSLLVGIDEERKELVVGIIDFIRTFTFDKKLEMVLKWNYSMLGSQRTTTSKMPTIISPELYRARFCEAMERYIQICPDRWTNLSVNGEY